MYYFFISDILFYNRKIQTFFKKFYYLTQNKPGLELPTKKKKIKFINIDKY